MSEMVQHDAYGIEGTQEMAGRVFNEDPTWYARRFNIQEAVGSGWPPRDGSTFNILETVQHSTRVENAAWMVRECSTPFDSASRPPQNSEGVVSIMILRGRSATVQRDATQHHGDPRMYTMPSHENPTR